MVQKNCIPARSPIPFPPIEFFENCIIVNKEILYTRYRYGLYQSDSMMTFFTTRCTVF